LENCATRTAQKGQNEAIDKPEQHERKGNKEKRGTKKIAARTTFHNEAEINIIENCTSIIVQNSFVSGFNEYENCNNPFFCMLLLYRA
jgi:hypothetical protein